MKQLIAAGLLSPDPRKNRRSRTWLHVTDEGREELARWLEVDPTADTPRDELVLRIALMKEHATATTFRHLHDELRRCEETAHVERALLGSPDRSMLAVSSKAANWLARRWVILRHDARATWCREAITLLRENDSPELSPAPPPAPARVLEPWEMENVYAMMRAEGYGPPPAHTDLHEPTTRSDTSG